MAVGRRYTIKPWRHFVFNDEASHGPSLHAQKDVLDHYKMSPEKIAEIAQTILK